MKKTLLFLVVMMTGTMTGCFVMSHGRTGGSDSGSGASSQPSVPIPQAPFGTHTAQTMAFNHILPSLQATLHITTSDNTQETYKNQLSNMTAERAGTNMNPGLQLSLCNIGVSACTDMSIKEIGGAGPVVFFKGLDPNGTLTQFSGQNLTNFANRLGMATWGRVPTSAEMGIIASNMAKAVSQTTDTGAASLQTAGSILCGMFVCSMSYLVR